MKNLFILCTKPFKIPFLSDDFDGFVFGKGGGKFPLVEDAERGRDEVAELVVELVSLFSSPPSGLLGRIRKEKNCLPNTL